MQKSHIKDRVFRRIDVIDLVPVGSSIHTALLDGESRQLGRAFGEVVRRRREAHDLSREALAKKACLSEQEIGLVENGETMPSLDTGYRIGSALGVPAADLVAEAELMAEYL
jgi:ribosome-binding protein aMBF1 (putative translation factor)